jgi:hypothetical protein
MDELEEEVRREAAQGGKPKPDFGMFGRPAPRR